MIQVALLRGINVGGKHKVAMAELRRIVAECGGRDVATYINSGNVVFEHPHADHVALAQRLESAVEEQLAVPCRVLVKAGADITAVAGAIPAGWTNGADRKTDVVYLLDGIDPSAASAALQPREGIDHVRHAPGAVVWMTARGDATRSGLLKLVGTPLYQQSTVRNVNTARKLAAMVAERAAS
jgi:uncharacterized protein (DUF1697 family)